MFTMEGSLVISSSFLKNELIIHIYLFHTKSIFPYDISSTLAEDVFKLTELQHNAFLIRKLTSDNLLLRYVWYRIGTNHSARAVFNWLVSLWIHTHAYVYNIVKTNSKKHSFHSISMTYHANLIKQGVQWIRVNCIRSVSIEHFDGIVVFCFCL